MVKRIVNEKISVIVGKCAENEWRRNNLLKLSHLIDTGEYLQAVFSYVTPYEDRIVNTQLIYNIVK